MYSSPLPLPGAVSTEVSLQGNSRFRRRWEDFQGERKKTYKPNNLTCPLDAIG